MGDAAAGGPTGAWCRACKEAADEGNVTALYGDGTDAAE
jgi:hypothetical protein